MTTTADQESKAQRKFKVVGTNPIRHDGVDKVTGRAKYGADILPSGLLHGKILRSPHAHATIRSIDTSKAEELPGVKAVLTSKDFAIVGDQRIDFGETRGSARMVAENVMADRKVLYKGHAIAAVAATSPDIAEDALELITVDYDILPPVLSILDAMKSDGPLLLENITTRFRAGSDGINEDTGVKSNVTDHVEFKLGNPKQGFEEAKVIVEREFHTSMVHQGYIEPHTSTGLWNSDGRVTIWTSTQGAFPIRASTATILGIPDSMVKIVPMEIGGGFGGKQVPYLDPVVALLSKKSGHPVKIVMTRQEVFEATGPASGSYIHCKIGANDSGIITAAEVYLAYEVGAFPGWGASGGMGSVLGPYKIENLKIDGYDVLVNKPKTAAYRAPSQPQANFAAESVIDELAEKLGIDPLEFRLKNAVQEGDRAANGVPYSRFGCREVEEAMMAHSHYSSPLVGPNRGRGIAVGYRLQGGGAGSSATMHVNADGTVNLITGSVDIGGTRTSIAMQAAEVLGLPVEDVFPTVADTDSVGYTGGTNGSRTTFDTGRAAILVAEEVIKKMKERAAMLWEAQPDDVEFADGMFAYSRNPEDRLTFKQLASKNMDTGGPVTCSVSDRQGGVGANLAGHMVDVEVDPDTGKVTILRYTTFLDAGKAIYPNYVEGQMQGAAVQGIGWALNEEYFYSKEGAMANSTFLDYRIPTSLDVPMIDCVIIEVPNPRHLFGVRGVGETVLVPPMAAIANAIYDAVGVRMSSLPMNPASVLESITKKNAEA